MIGDFYKEVAMFKTPPPVVQNVVLPLLSSIGRWRGYRPYYERHFEPGEIDAVLTHWAAHRAAAFRRLPAERGTVLIGSLPCGSLTDPGRITARRPTNAARKA